jgi:hypothetical protein
MHPYCPAMPYMPRVANFAYIPNMGVALLSCIISNAPTKAKEISCSSLLHCLHIRAVSLTSTVMNASRTQSTLRTFEGLLPTSTDMVWRCGAAPVLDLLAKWPKLEQLQKAQRKTLETFLRQHRRTAEEATAWAKQVSEAIPAVQDSVLVDSYVLEVTALVALLKHANEH